MESTITAYYEHLESLQLELATSNDVRQKQNLELEILNVKEEIKTLENE